MQVKLNKPSFFQRAVAQLFLGGGGLILLTFICFRLGLNILTVGFAYLIVIALCSLIGSFTASVVLSLGAVAFLNYFFAPPLFSFRVDYPEDALAISAFLTTSIVVAGLIRKVRKTADQAEASRRALVDTIPAMVWSAQPDGSRDFHSHRWLDFTGLSVAEGSGYGWAAVLHAQDRATVMEKWRSAVATEQSFEVEARLRSAKGEYRWFLIRAEPLRSEIGSIIKWYGTSTDIEDRKRATEALRESEAHWRDVFEHNPVMYFMIDPTGTVLSVNSFGATQLGYAVNELIGQSVLNVFFEEDREVVRRNVAVCLEELGHSHTWEIRKVRKDGKVLWVRENATAVRRSDDRSIVLIACEDITERKRTEDALRQSESMLVEGQRLTRVGSWIYAPPDIAVFWSAMEYEIFGLDPKDGPPGNIEAFLPLVHPDDRDRIRANVEEILGSLQSFEYTYRIVRKDGDIRLIRELGRPVFNEGALTHFVGASMDITEQQQIEDSLRLSEAYMAQAQQLSGVGSWAYTPSGTCEHWSAEMFRMFGYDPAKGAPPIDAVLSLVHSDDRQAAGEATARFFEHGEALDIRFRFIRPDGRQRIIRDFGAPVYKNGAITRFVGACLDVTELERLTEELRLKEKELHALIDSIPALVSAAQPDGTLDFVNQRWLEYLGIDKEEWLDGGWKNVIHPEDFENVNATWLKALETGRAFENEMRWRRADGEYRWFHGRTVPMRDDSGNVARWYGTLHDIDDRKRTEDALRLSEAYMAHAQQLAGIGSWAYKSSHIGGYWDVCEHWSPEMWRIAGFDPSKGYPPTELIFSRIHPEDLQPMIDANAQVINDDRPLNIKYRYFHPDGQLRVLHSFGTLLREDGVATRFVGATIDITDQEQRLEALRQSELYLAEGQRLAHQGSWSFNPAGYYDFWSEELFRVYGFDPARGAPTLEQYLSAVHPEDREFMSRTIQEMLAQGLGCDVTKRIVRPGGEVRYIRCVGVPLLDKGILKSIFGTAMDVTEQEHLTQEMQRREAYLAEAQKLSRTGSFGWNVARGEIFWSEETFRIFEYDRAAKPSLELVLQRTHPEDRAVVRQFLERVTDDGKDWDFEHRLLTPNGSTKYVRAVARAEKDALGALEFVGAVMDITATRRADEELHQTRTQLTHFARLTTLGELTASIAHEVNQPLSGVINSANAGVRWLDSQPPDVQRARQSIDRIIRDAGRASEVVARVRDLAKKTPPRKGWLNINETVEEIISLTRQEVRKNHVRLKIQLSADVPLILADRIQLQQVILNLMINAVEALTAVPDAERVLQMTTTAGPSGDVGLTVVDSGPGLDQEKLEEIFGAFYTTKPDGMGMGLAVSRSIIEAHGGSLWANKNEPRGAIFQFTLPKDQGENL